MLVAFDLDDQIRQVVWGEVYGSTDALPQGAGHNAPQFGGFRSNYSMHTPFDAELSMTR